MQNSEKIGASLIGFHHRRLKGLQGMSSLATDLGLCGIFFFFFFFFFYTTSIFNQSINHIFCARQLLQVQREW